MKFALLLTICLAGASSAEPIVVIGDSHTVGTFGQTLARALLERGEVSFHAVCSASISWWLGDPKKRRNLSSPCYSRQAPDQSVHEVDEPPPAGMPTAQELLVGSPELVVIALGSNPDQDTASSDPDVDTAAAAMRLLALIPSGTKCIWVGPPPMPSRLDMIDHFYEELSALIREAGSSCRIFDSRRILSSNQATKDHFGGAPTKAWAQAVVRSLP